MQTNPYRRPKEASESTAARRPSRRNRRAFGFMERWWAARLEKGGHYPEMVRERCADEARLQVWLYDRRPDHP